MALLLAGPIRIYEPHSSASTLKPENFSILQGSGHLGEAELVLQVGSHSTHWPRAHASPGPHPGQSYPLCVIPSLIETKMGFVVSG